MFDWLEVPAIIFAAVMALVGSIILIVISCQLAFDKPACEKIGKRAKIETFFTLSTGCLIKSGDAWVKDDVYFGQKQEITIKQR